MATFVVTVPDDVYEAWLATKPEESVDQALIDAMQIDISLAEPIAPPSPRSQLQWLRVVEKMRAMTLAEIAKEENR